MAKVVVAVRDEGGPGGRAYSYSQARIASVLSLMGVRGEHAAKIAKTVLRQLLQEADGEGGAGGAALGELGGGERPGPVRAPPRVSREAYDRVCRRAMAEFGYDRPVHAADFRVASSLRERRSSVCVLLCGTSGTGKSTMASLLASRLGIATVLSTDSIRHMLRSFSTPEAQPLIWASTYKAGDCISLAPEKLAAKKCVGAVGPFSVSVSAGEGPGADAGAPSFPGTRPSSWRASSPSRATRPRASWSSSSWRR